MMVVQMRARVSLEEFEAFVQRPENAEKLFEFIHGEVVEAPSNPYASEIANLISFFIRLFLRENNIKGYVTGADGGYIIDGNIYAPDVAYISQERQPELPRRGYNPNPPELAVEVISDASNIEEAHRLRLKTSNYLAVGVIVWIVNTEQRLVEVHQVGRAVQLLDVKGVLKAEELFPNFELPVKDIFPSQEAEGEVG